MTKARCQSCSISIEPLDDDLADELRLDGSTEEEIDLCRTHCDQCRDDILLARALANPKTFERFLDWLRGGRLH